MTMKKVFMILATIAMVCTVSCKKDNKKDKPAGGGGEEESAIVIDGKFADWTALGKNVAMAEAPADPAAGVAGYTGMITMKAVGDEDNLYLYFEYELETDEAGEVIQEAAPFDMFFNSDGNAETGFISWIWDKANTGWDVLIETESGILNGKTAINSSVDDWRKYEPVKRADGTLGCYDATTGEQLDGWDSDHDAKMTEWSADGPFQTTIELDGVVSNGIAMYEVSIPRGVIGATKAGTIGVSITISNASWTTKGILPLDGESVGIAGMLPVVLK